MSIEISQEVADRALSYRGHGHHVESALGSLVFGQLYGRRGLQMLHRPAILKRHERVLGVKFSEVCPDTTSATDRILGVQLAKKAGAFWRFAEGKSAGRERFQLTDTDSGQGSLL